MQAFVKCSITPKTTKVGSSYSHVRTVQVSAADSQTVLPVATGVSKPRCRRLTLTFTLTSRNLALYITLLLQCLITNASQRAQPAQPHTDVEIMKFLTISFLDEILWNLSVYMNIYWPSQSSWFAVIQLFWFEIFGQICAKLPTKHPVMVLVGSCGPRMAEVICSPNHNIPN